jgi:hypothetical protein
MWRELLLDSLRRPRAAAQRVLRLNLPLPTLLQAAVVVACAGTLAVYAAARVIPPPAGADFARLAENPLLAAVLHLGDLALIAAVITWVGRLFGGTGKIAGAIALVIWFQAIMLLLFGAMLLALATIPPLALLLGIGLFVWTLWALASLVAELHGFENLVVVFAGTVLTVIVFVLLMMSLASQETA